MNSNVTNIKANKWLIEIDWIDEDIDASTSAIIVGPEDDAIAYIPTLARDYRDNHPDLFPQPEPEEGEHEEDFE